MISVLLLSCSFLALSAQAPGDSDKPEPQAAAIVASVEKVIADAIAIAEPSVVAIHRSKNENGPETLAIRGRKRARIVPMFLTRRASPIPDLSNMLSFDYGSGVVIGDQGEILTLYHVVRGASELYVRAAGRQLFEAEVIAADPRSDLAVIVPAMSEGAEFPRLKPIAIGDSGRLRKGAFLIALGNSFNAAQDGSPSASWGILSNVSRRLELDVDEAPGPRKTLGLGLVHYPTLLQLDAKLNLGMSGGAVINLKGELVGLTTMASSPAGFDAMAGYAIPMDKITKRAISSLTEGKEVEYGLLGIQADDKGTNYVSQIKHGSPAYLAQLQVNDQIVAVNGIPVTNFDSLILAVNVFPAGEAVRLKIQRGDETIERTIVLAKLLIEGEVIATNRPKPWRGLRVEYTAHNRGSEPAMFGVVAAEVEDGSKAADSGLKRGQLIRRVAGKEVRSPREFADAVAGLEGPVTLDTDLGQVTVK
jgi:serine protease Do